MDRFRVLVVDDEVDFLETIVKRLKKRQVDAEGVETGEAAVEVLNNKLFDVVLLDVTPISLKIETLGGVATTLIDKNTTSTITKGLINYFKTGNNSFLNCYCRRKKTTRARCSAIFSQLYRQGPNGRTRDFGSAPSGP